MLSVAALLEDNRYRVVYRLLRAVGLGLGLGHGFGFASACADLSLPRSARAPALVGFNRASKPGRIALVYPFPPIAYRLRGAWFYRRAVLTGGSGIIAVIAFLPLLETSLDLKLLPVH